jgi:two-component system CheB/CheR fusion protein
MGELWGVRNDEAVGRFLFNLDIGMPVEELRPTLRSILAEEASDQPVQLVQAINRRGRSIEIQVTISPLRRDGGQVTGAIILMDPRAVENAS